LFPDCGGPVVVRRPVETSGRDEASDRASEDVRAVFNDILDRLRVGEGGLDMDRGGNLN